MEEVLAGYGEELGADRGTPVIGDRVGLSAKIDDCEDLDATIDGAIGDFGYPKRGCGSAVWGPMIS